jgi:TldD protein
MTGRLFDDFGEGMRPSLERLLGVGRAGGADFVELFLERRRSLTAVSEDGRLSSVDPSLSVGAGVRLFRGGVDAYVATNQLTYEGLMWAIEKALGILGLSLPGTERMVPEVSLELLRDYAVAKGKLPWLAAIPSVGEIGGVLTRTTAATRDRVAHVESVRSSSVHSWQEVLVASSDGTFARDIRLNNYLSLSAVAADGAHRAQVSRTAGATARPGFALEVDVDTMSRSLAESAGTMLRADYVESGRCPVVMGNGFGGVIFHEACGHLLETTQLQRKTTPFADKVGQPIAHESVTAWDEGLAANEYGSIAMDDEGMPAQRTLLIERGILRNFLSDRKGSMKCGVPRSGSGRRQNYSFAAASRMRNTYFAPGNHSTEEILASVDRGIYCAQMGGGSVGATGDFNFGVQEAYAIENGKIGKPLKGATLIGTASEILMKISMFGKDLALAPGHCGSVSGSIYTTVGQPHIRVDSITVGGR